MQIKRQLEQDDVQSKKRKSHRKVDQTTPRTIRTRKRKAMVLPNSIHQDLVDVPSKKVVLIWDLDETLVLFSSLCSGQYAKNSGKNTSTSIALGENMMCFVFTVLEKYLFFQDVEKDTIGHISHMKRYDDGKSLHLYDFTSDMIELDPIGSISRMRKLAYRYRRILEIYQREQTVEFLTPGTKEAEFCHNLRQSIDTFGDGWGRAAQRALQASCTAGYINVLVTNTQLVPALCKCLIYNLDPWFTPEVIYSSSHLRKKECFDIIRTKYGSEYTFIGIGDGPEEQRASLDCGMPFFQINKKTDLDRLAEKLDMHTNRLQAISTALL